MSNAGIPLRIIQEISGHRNARTVAARRKSLGQHKSEERSLHFPCFLILENARYRVGSGLLVYDERPNRRNRSIPTYQCSNAVTLTDSVVGSGMNYRSHANGYTKYGWAVSSVCFIER